VIKYVYEIDYPPSGIYVSREKAEAVSQKPQHFSKHTFTTGQAYHWLHFLWRVILEPLDRSRLAGDAN
jgi:hypothetical protein